jgi:hypothetical protein
VTILTVLALESPRLFAATPEVNGRRPRPSGRRDLGATLADGGGA